MTLRKEIWARLSGAWKIDDLLSYGSFIPLEQITDQMDLILKGQTQGRVVVAFDQ